MRTIDLDKLRVYQEKYRDEDPRPGSSKYLDVTKWMKRSLYHLYSLNLHRSRPVRILDLGTGCGYFPYACMHFGHDVTAIDLDTVPLYNDLTQLLGVQRKVRAIRAFEGFPDCGGPFDLITALMVCFNNHDQPDLWGCKEWGLFLEDLATNHLVHDGKAMLQLNPERDGKCFSDELLDFFLEHSATIHNDRVYFESMASFRCSA